MRNRSDELLVCPNCRDKEFKKADVVTEASECGCRTPFEGMTLCAMHAYAQNRCRVCGADLAEIEDAERKRSIRDRRRRALNAAIREREPFRDEERERREHERRESGRGGKTRQRHQIRRR